jgi:D-alanyl-lipoteichoic acid acyltransferase DltB (MBOAT superfamily)
VDGVLGDIAFEFAIRPAGWMHLAVGDRVDVLRGPVGVLGYVLFVPWLWLIPRRWTAGYLAGTALVWSLVTLGHAYTVGLVLLTVGGWALLRLARAGPFSLAVRPWMMRNAVAVILAAVYGTLLVWPQPALVPPVSRPLYFYLQWAGVGYIFLKLYHLVIDVSAGDLPRPRFAAVAAYLLFQPTLRMGPIYRGQEFFAQLHDRPARFDPAWLGMAAIRLTLGLVRWGLMIWLTIVYPAATVFGAPDRLPTATLLVGVAAQPIAIFLWISGYVDIAIGLGHLMGFTVPENFNYPWIAASLRTFWRRWHITLGAWLRDYIYIPLGGSRRHVFINYCATFGFCGLWHGLYASYFAWGLSQGVGLWINRRWMLYWQGQRDRTTALYVRLRQARLIESPLSLAAAWLVTTVYQLLTIALFMDEHHCGTRFLPELAKRIVG